MREWRTVACLAMLAKTQYVVPLVRRMFSFLPTVSGTPGRRLPRYNRYGILVSPREAVEAERRGLVDPWDNDL